LLKIRHLLINYTLSYEPSFRKNPQITTITLGNKKNYLPAHHLLWQTNRSLLLVTKKPGNPLKSTQSNYL